MPADIESPLIFETAALNINPSPEGLPPNSSPTIVYSEGRESLAMQKRWWNRVNPTITSGGSANAQSLTYSVAPTEGYKQGQTFTFIPGFNNGGATTLNVNGLGAKNIYAGGQLLTGGELVTSSVVQIVYDGTNFQLLCASAGKLVVSGVIYLGQGLNRTGVGATQQTLGVGAGGTIDIFNKIPGQASNLNFSTNGLQRWQWTMSDTTAEGGSNAGSNMAVNAFTDAGGLLGGVFSAVRSTQVVTFVKTIVNGPSDARLKENVAPLEGALDKVQRLKGVSFNFIKDDAKRRQIGLVAQDVAPIFPEILQDYIQPDEPPALAIDYPKLIPVLIEATKELAAKVTELTAKVARLEAGLAAASQA